MGTYSLLTLVAKAIIIVTVDSHGPVEIDLGTGPPVALVEVVKQIQGMANHDPETYFEPTETTLAHFELVSFRRLATVNNREIWTLVVRHRATPRHPQNLHVLGVFSFS